MSPMLRREPSVRIVGTHDWERCPFLIWADGTPVRIDRRSLSIPNRQSHFTLKSVSDRSGQVELRRLLLQSRSVAIRLLRDESRTFWLFKGTIFSETEGLGPDDVVALVAEREIKKARRIQRASNLAAAVGAPSGRVAISEEVRLFVWRRDGGKCVKCGGREALEFDHVIPVILGGSGSPKNLQILCESCNRMKGADVA